MAAKRDRVVPALELRAFVSRVLEAVGMRPPEAEIVADALVWCELRGNEPHGVSRLPAWVARLRAGGSPPEAVPTVMASTNTTAVMDARAALGPLAATRAMELAVEKAGRYRLGAVVVRNSSSLGAVGYYPMIAVRRELIGLTLTNSMPLMAPWGGAAKLLGNQAYAIGCPAGRHFPLLLDTSNTATSWARVNLARERGEKLAPGLALDKHGRPTIDPAEALEGLLQPAGGHKGYGLALMWEVLTGVLAGLVFGPNVGSHAAPDRPQEVSHFALALDPSAFLPLDQFKARVDSLSDQVHAVPKAPDVDQIYMPGERGFLVAQERERDGIPLSARRVSQLQKVAEQVGVSPLPAPPA